MKILLHWIRHDQNMQQLLSTCNKAVKFPTTCTIFALCLVFFALIWKLQLYFKFPLIYSVKTTFLKLKCVPHRTWWLSSWQWEAQQRTSCPLLALLCGQQALSQNWHPARAFSPAMKSVFHQCGILIFFPVCLVLFCTSPSFPWWSLFWNFSPQSSSPLFFMSLVFYSYIHLSLAFLLTIPLFILVSSMFLYFLMFNFPSSSIVFEFNLTVKPQKPVYKNKWPSSLHVSVARLDTCSLFCSKVPRVGLIGSQVFVCENNLFKSNMSFSTFEHLETKPLLLCVESSINYLVWH